MLIDVEIDAKVYLLDGSSGSLILDALNEEIKRENQDVEWILVSLRPSAAIGEEEEERRRSTTTNVRDSRYKSPILLESFTNVKDSRYVYSQDTTCSARRIYSSFFGVCFCRCEKLILPALDPKFFPLAIFSAAFPFSCSYSLLSSPVYSTLIVCRILIVCRTLIVCHEGAERYNMT